MVHVMLLTRGQLAHEWLRATTAVCGTGPEEMTAVTLPYDNSCDEDRGHVRIALRELRKRGPVLVLTDLHGSTPTNVAAEVAQDAGVAVVAGANLAMVVRLACDPVRDRPLPELCDWICEKGRSAIRTVCAGPAAAEGGR